MLIDSYKRKIDYLRISVTDRCNLRCIYCMPASGILQKAPQEILSFEEIFRIVKLCIDEGINKIKITGGEPLVRKDLPKLFQLLYSLPGLKDLSLTTNGMFLEEYIKELKNAGLKRLNISIDSLDEQIFKQITRFGKLSGVLKGIDTALEERFFIKLNVVIIRGLNDNEILRFARFAQERKIIIRFIELMPIVNNMALNQDLFMSSDEIKDRLRLLGSLRELALNFGNGPAKYYKIEEAGLIVGFISPISCKFCFACNRLRLTSSGKLMPCLANEDGFDLSGPLRKNNDNDVSALLRKAIFLKPQGHNLTFSSPGIYQMSEIGG